jgi:hypothetical protein
MKKTRCDLCLCVTTNTWFPSPRKKKVVCVLAFYTPTGVLSQPGEPSPRCSTTTVTWLKEGQLCPCVCLCACVKEKINKWNLRIYCKIWEVPSEHTHLNALHFNIRFHKKFIDVVMLHFQHAHLMECLESTEFPQKYLAKLRWKVAKKSC